MNNNSKVYIVILNHKGWKDSLECLESVFKLDYLNFQILLVDNSPTLESIEHIESWAKGESVMEVSTSFPNLVKPNISKPLDYKIISEEESKKQFYDNPLLIIKADENLGFSTGNNVALNYAMRKDDFDFCWLLNNDTVVDKKSLINQIEYIKNKELLRIGILGSKLIYYFQPTKIQAVGGIFRPQIFVTKQIGEGMDVKTSKGSLPSIDYVVGASMLVSNTFLKEVGTLCEDYFLYFEELDWAYRAEEKGWKIDWCPKSLVYHKEGSSIGSSSNHKERSFFSEINAFKSRKIFSQKFYKKRLLFYFSSFLIILNRIRRLQFRLAWTFVKILLFD